MRKLRTGESLQTPSSPPKFKHGWGTPQYMITWRLHTNRKWIYSPKLSFMSLRFPESHDTWSLRFPEGHDTRSLRFPKGHYTRTETSSFAQTSAPVSLTNAAVVSDFLHRPRASLVKVWGSEQVLCLSGLCCLQLWRICYGGCCFFAAGTQVCWGQLPPSSTDDVLARNDLFSGGNLITWSLLESLLYSSSDFFFFLLLGVVLSTYLYMWLTIHNVLIFALLCVYEKFTL